MRDHSPLLGSIWVIVHKLSCLRSCRASSSHSIEWTVRDWCHAWRGGCHYQEVRNCIPHVHACSLIHHMQSGMPVHGGSGGLDVCTQKMYPNLLFGN